ncbi:MAG: pyridoxamine 5'-phosphate oxidase family protein [Amaricoccus sp.]|uniref:pyridoxamine 5'-phosphate oxidase family protein n=1 Tax=Amaricoccus sp. TaxID=1872485 RepID=UPI003315F9E1
MAKQFSGFEPEHERFVAEQHIFFVATAAPEGRVNLSPKGMDSVRVLGPNRLVWLNLTGSGNETAAHLRESPRMTVMWCSFTRRPLILRAYGAATAIHRDTPGWAELYAHFPDEIGARQIFDMTVDLVQTSCGYAVPFMDFREPRETLHNWAEKAGPDAIATYWAERNTVSIDGKPTGIPADLPVS